MALTLRLLCLCMSVGLVLAKDEVVVFVVEPTWDCVASYVKSVPLLHEYKIIKVMTHLGPPGPCSDHQVVNIYQNITYNSWTPNDLLAAEQICPKLQSLGLPIAAVIPTFDPATYLADRLSACLGARGNPFEGPLAHARFDKWAMSESVRKAGLRAVKEVLVTTWTEAKAYLESLNPPLSEAKPVIIKALQSSNSQGLLKVNSMEQAHDYFRKAMGSTTQYGDKVGNVLISEFLSGKEYVVDSVSRDGVHKTVVVWNEDLRPGNGYFDLYYGFKIQDPNEPKIKAIIEYAHKVLDAAGVVNGASDMEVFWIEDEGAACVTDLNARWTALMWHDGLALENMITGTNQITATINAFLDPDAFNKMPTIPSINQHGAILFTLPHHTGAVTDVPGLRVAEKLPSFVTSFNEGLYPGKVIEKLYNSHPAIFILLANKEQSVVEKDYNVLIDLQYADGFFDMVRATANTSFLAVRNSGRGQQLAAISAFSMISVVAIWALVTMSRRTTEDHTQYITIE